jgi:hypothetical protein
MPVRQEPRYQYSVELCCGWHAVERRRPYGAPNSKNSDKSRLDPRASGWTQQIASQETVTKRCLDRKRSRPRNDC